jgi:molybdate transport system substrate-binding protein
MKTRYILNLVFIWGLLFQAVSGAEITVFAAASLADALQEIAPLYARATGERLRFNFGGSGLLARQIREGAPADLFFSADEARLDELDNAALLLAGTRRRVLGNSLVLIVPSDRPALNAPTSLLSTRIRRLAMGEPTIVPAGTYAKSYLDRLGLWDAVKPKLVFTESVRAVLAAVEAGNADAGFVFKTDALRSTRARIAFSVSPDDSPVIIYPCAVVRTTPIPDSARRLLAWFGEAEARSVFIKYGFTVSP